MYGIGCVWNWLCIELVVYGTGCVWNGLCMELVVYGIGCEVLAVSYLIEGTDSSKHTWAMTEANSCLKRLQKLGSCDGSNADVAPCSNSNTHPISVFGSYSDSLLESFSL